MVRDDASDEVRTCVVQRLHQFVQLFLVGLSDCTEHSLPGARPERCLPGTRHAHTHDLGCGTTTTEMLQKVLRNYNRGALQLNKLKQSNKNRIGLTLPTPLSKLFWSAKDGDLRLLKYHGKPPIMEISVNRLCCHLAIINHFEISVIGTLPRHLKRRRSQSSMLSVKHNFVPCLL